METENQKNDIVDEGEDEIQIAGGGDDGEDFQEENENELERIERLGQEKKKFLEENKIQDDVRRLSSLNLWSNHVQ